MPASPLWGTVQEAGDAARTAYLAWAQSARLADAKAEIEVLKSEAVALLDKHLSKTAEQVRQGRPLLVFPE